MFGPEIKGIFGMYFPGIFGENVTMIDFSDFVRVLSSLSTRSSIHEKAQICFRIFDTNKDGFIDPNELKTVIKWGLLENPLVKIQDSDIDTIISKTFQQMDKDGDGLISLQDLKPKHKNPRNPFFYNIKY